MPGATWRRSRPGQSGRRTTATRGASISRRCFVPTAGRSQGQGRLRRDPARLRPRRHRHPGDGVRRHPREPAPAGGRSVHPRRRGFRRRHPRPGDAGVRARRGRPRPGDHSGQHQPRRTRADGHRPQLPGQDQRQHRQFGGAVVGGRRGRQDGVGDPLGRRHDHGPLHRPQHPQHPRVDHPQLPDSAWAPCRSIRRWRRSTASPRT